MKTGTGKQRASLFKTRKEVAWILIACLVFTMSSFYGFADDANVAEDVQQPAMEEQPPEPEEVAPEPEVIVPEPEAQPPAAEVQTPAQDNQTQTPTTTETTTVALNEDVIVTFDKLREAIKDELIKDLFEDREVDFGTAFSKLDLPKELEAVDADAAAVLIKDIKWEATKSTPEYDGNIAGEYYLTAKLPDGYVCSDQKLPEIKVVVNEEAVAEPDPELVADDGVLTTLGDGELSALANPDGSVDLKVTNIKFLKDDIEIPITNTAPIELNNGARFDLDIEWEFLEQSLIINNGNWGIIDIIKDMPINSETVTRDLMLDVSTGTSVNIGHFIVNADGVPGRIKLVFDSIEDVLEDHAEITGTLRLRTYIEYNEDTKPIEIISPYSEQHSYTFHFNPSNVIEGDIAKESLAPTLSSTGALDKINWMIDVNKSLKPNSTNDPVIKDKIITDPPNIDHEFDLPSVKVYPLNVSMTDGDEDLTIGEALKPTDYDAYMSGGELHVKINGTAPLDGKAYRITYSTTPKNKPAVSGASYKNQAYMGTGSPSSEADFQYIVKPLVSSKVGQYSAATWSGDDYIAWTIKINSENAIIPTEWITVKDILGGTGSGALDRPLNLALYLTKDGEIVSDNLWVGGTPPSDYINPAGYVAPSTAGFEFQLKADPNGDRTYYGYELRYTTAVTDRGLADDKYINKVEIGSTPTITAEVIIPKDVGPGVLKEVTKNDKNEPIDWVSMDDQGKGKIPWTVYVVPHNDELINLSLVDTFPDLPVHPGDSSKKAEMQVVLDSTFSIVTITPSGVSSAPLKRVTSFTSDPNEYMVTNISNGFEVKFNSLFKLKGLRLKLTYYTEFDMSKLMNPVTGEYPSQNYTFKNNIVAYQGTVKLDDANAEFKLWNSHFNNGGKSGKFSNDKPGEIDWTFNLNYNHVDFTAPLVINDIFTNSSALDDPGQMEFLEDTLKVCIVNPNGTTTDLSRNLDYTLTPKSDLREGFELTIHILGSNTYSVTYSSRLTGNTATSYENKVLIDGWDRNLHATVEQKEVNMLGKTGDPSDGETVKWTLTVNEDNSLIKNAVIIDELDPGQIFDVKANPVHIVDRLGNELVESTDEDPDGDYKVIVTEAVIAPLKTKIQIIFEDSYIFDKELTISYTSDVVYDELEKIGGVDAITNNATLIGENKVIDSVREEVYHLWSNFSGTGAGKNYPVQIVKKSATTGDFLPGAIFRVERVNSDQSISHVVDIKTDDTLGPGYGKTPEFKLRTGNYKITEISAPDGYGLPDVISMPVEINQGGYVNNNNEVFEFTFEDPVAATLDVTKKVELVDTSLTPADKFTFLITDSIGNPIELYDEDDVATSDVNEQNITFTPNGDGGILLPQSVPANRGKFWLNADAKATISKLGLGSTYIVSELDTNVPNLLTTYSINTGNSVAFNPQNPPSIELNTTDDNSIEFINTYTTATTPIHDAALVKWISKVESDVSADQTFTEPAVGKSPVPIVRIGDRVTFNIKLINQCSEILKITSVSDYLPAGYTFDAADNTGWTGTTGTLTYTPDPASPIELAPKGSVGGTDTAEITLILTVNENANESPDPANPKANNLRNYAEISGMTDENDNTVEDIDSTPDDNPGNDGSTETDNDVEQHRQDNTSNPKTIDEKQDEDDHDYAETKLIEPIISVEVDKDTIRRTSAAYISLPGQEGFDNVGQEKYRYDVNARSMSNINGDEFIIKDPLENVNKGLVRVDKIWTPVVWGDVDNEYKIFYSTNGSSVLQEWTANGTLDPRVRYSLDFSNTNLTYIEFRYGEVEVGFTSSVSQYDSTNGENRNTNGGITIPDIPQIPIGAMSVLQSLNAGTLGALSTQLESPDIFSPLASGITIGNDGGVDWRPATDSSAVNYSKKLLAVQGSLNLKPITYLVTALDEMNSESVNIDSSASSHIYRYEDQIAKTNLQLKAQDQDAVRTKVITTFEPTPDNIDVDNLVLQDSFLNDAIEQGFTISGGRWYTPEGAPITPGTKSGTYNKPASSTPRGGANHGGKIIASGDTSPLGAWVTLLVLAIVCLVAVVSTEMLYRRRRALATIDGDYRNTHKVDPRKVVFSILFAILFAVSFPLSAYVGYAAPEDNITVEYRYNEGETINVPDTMTNAGREYKLLSAADPVRESTLPQTRTYNYKIDGAITPAQLATIQGLGDVTITPVDIVKESKVDKLEEVENLPNNDVDNFPQDKDFEVLSATDPSGKANVSLKRAGIEFEVQTWEVDGELPDLYKAKVVYRGIETTNELGYYLAETTYTSTVVEGATDVFVVVAVYEPTDLPVVPEIDQNVVDPDADVEPLPEVTPEPEIVVPEITAQPEPAPITEPVPEPVVTVEGLSPADQILIDNQVPTSLTSPIQNIVDGNTPLGSGSVKDAWSVLSLFISMLAIIFAIVYLIMLLVRRSKGEMMIANQNANAGGLNSALIMTTFTFICFIVTPFIWLMVDNLSQPQVWINTWTPMVVIPFVIGVALFVVNKVKNGKSDEEKTPKGAVA